MPELEQAESTRTLTIAKQLVAILEAEPSAVRQRAVAIAMILLGEQRSPEPASHESKGTDDRVETRAEFFSRYETLKPSENAYLCAAYHYSLYGNIAFSLDEIRSIASDAGIIIPDRLSMTLKQAGKGGKKFFQAAGRDAYKPTVAAGLMFNELWKVRRGKAVKTPLSAEQ